MKKAAALLKQVTLLDGDSVHLVGFAIGHVAIKIDNPSEDALALLKANKLDPEITLMGCFSVGIQGNELRFFLVRESLQKLPETIPLSKDSVVTVTVKDDNRLGLDPCGNRNIGFAYFTEYAL